MNQEIDFTIVESIKEVVLMAVMLRLPVPLRLKELFEDGGILPSFKELKVAVPKMHEAVLGYRIAIASDFVSHIRVPDTQSSQFIFQLPTDYQSAIEVLPASLELSEEQFGWFRDQALRIEALQRCVLQCERIIVLITAVLEDET